MTDDPDRERQAGELPHDEELERLYRAMPKLEPRSEIDAAIVAAARDRSTRHRPASRRAFVRWGIPLAAAASITVTVLLTHLSETPHAVDATSSRVADNVAGDVAEVATDSYAARHDEVDAAAKARAKEAPPAAPAAKPEALAARPYLERRENAAPSEQRESAAKPDAAADLAAAPLAKARPAAPPPVETKALSDQVPSAGASRSADGTDAASAWPFGLEPGMTTAEACRRIASSVAGPCAFERERADVTVTPPKTIDRGANAGLTARRIVLVEESGTLASVELYIDGRDQPVILRRDRR